jgi:hypothetical protein
VDTGRNYLQHGPIRVRVQDVRVQRADPKAGTSAEGKRLLIELRLINVKGGSRVAFESWGTTHTGGIEHRPELEDHARTSYRWLPAAPGAGVAGKARTASLAPSKAVTDVLVFEGPGGRVDFLRLKLPASAFGLEGTLKLLIPGSMIE